MRFPYVLSLLLLCLTPVLSQDCIDRLRELGMDKFADSMEEGRPDLVDLISNRDDITLYAPRNDAFRPHDPHDPHPERLARRNHQVDRYGTQIAHDPTPPDNGGQTALKRRYMQKRGLEKRPKKYPRTNFEKIWTFLDCNFINLGSGGQVQAFVRNYATPLERGVDSHASIEVVTGLGDIQHTTRGPFKCDNGIIYEVNEFFTTPYTFTETIEHINKSQIFLHSIVAAGKLSIFENTPAITIFVPIDKYMSSACENPKSYILWVKNDYAVLFSPDLLPGAKYPSMSGEIISVTRGENGEKLVNGRRLVQPNVPIKNGVIHFIDGPLFDNKL